MTPVLQFIKSLPSPIAQGMVWGIMAIGVYITYRILDLADLTVDGSFGTGGATFVVLTIGGMNVYLSLFIAFLAGCAAGLVTGILHTKFGIPAILAGILTQLALYSVNLRIMGGKANTPISKRNYDLIITSSVDEIGKTILICAVFVVVIIAILHKILATYHFAERRKASRRFRKRKITHGPSFKAYKNMKEKKVKKKKRSSSYIDL